MAFCTIARDENNEIQAVHAPNRQPSILYNDIVESLNDPSKEGKEAALKIWGRAYTPDFKSKFGDWELISEAKQFINEIQGGVYRELFKQDPQRVLFEISMQSHTGGADAKETLKGFGGELVAIAKELYPNVKVGDIYKPVVSKPLDENGEPLAIQVMNPKEKTQFTSKQTPADETTKPSTTDNQIYGSKDSISFFENLSQNISLQDTPTESYYTNGSLDPVINTLRKYTRLTDFTRNQFASEESKNRWKDVDGWLDDETKKVFVKANADVNDKIPYGPEQLPQTYEEIKNQIRKSYDESRVRGNIIHKMIEGYLKHRDVDYFAQDIAIMREGSNIGEHELVWLDNKRVQEIMNDLGMNSEDFGNTDIAFRDNVASELKMISDALGVGTSNDGFVEHSDKTVSFFDYKTGAKFLSDENSIKKMLFNEGLSNPIYESKLNKAKLELVMRMIIAKMNKPDLAVRDLKIVYVSRYYGNQVRTIDVQSYLDYIDNNYRISIKELEGLAKKDPSYKDKLAEKKKEYTAMKTAKVFDFFQYQGSSKVLEQDTDLQTITDPEKKIEYLKNKSAQGARGSMILNKNIITPDSFKSIRNAVVEVLNSYKSANVTSVTTANNDDISTFAARTLGLRDQKNSFLQSFSLLYESAVEKFTNQVNSKVGEQSEFRKADRALYKEYFERTGRTQARGARTFSYSKSNTDVPISEQGVFDFMYTWKSVGGENVRVGAVYTEKDVANGTITQTQYNYYKTSKVLLRELYEGVRTKTAYINKYNNKKVTYGEEYIKQDGFNFKAFEESFLPTVPFSSAEEIIEKNYLTNNLNPVKIGKEYLLNYNDRYNLAVQNEDRFNIGVPLKYMSSQYLEDDEHSYNVTHAIDLFSRNMIHKLEMDDVYDIGQSTVAVMSDVNDPNNVNKKGELRMENAIFALKNHLEQNIIGRRRETTNYFGKKNVNANKRVDLIIDNIGGFISKNAFWFAPLTASFNGLYGLFTNGKEGLIGSASKRFFGDANAVTLSHMLEASKISGIHQGVNLTKNSNIKRQFNEDWEGSYYKDKVNFMNKMFRLGNKNYEYTDASLMLGVHNRIFTGENAYVAQGLGEDLSNETLVIASMLARKVEVKSVDSFGKEVTKYLKKDGSYTTDPNESGLENMWDIYKLNETSGEYEYTGPVRFRDKDGIEVKGMTTLESLRIKTYLERMYGAYSPEQKTWLERYALGRMLMKFRKFQIMNIKENFTLNSHQKYVGEYVQLFNADGSPKLKDGQPLYDWQQEAMKSRLLVFSSLIGGWINLKSGKKWSELSIEDKKQATRFALQIGFYAITLALGMGGLVPPEDQNKLYMKRIVRLTEDLAGISPTQLLKGTTTLDSYPEQLYKFADAGTKFVQSVLSDDVVQSGKYEGDYKGWNTLEDFIPVYHPLNQASKFISGE